MLLPHLAAVVIEQVLRVAGAGEVWAKSMEILRSATAFFAKAEFDRRLK